MGEILTKQINGKASDTLSGTEIELTHSVSSENDTILENLTKENEIKKQQEIEAIKSKNIILKEKNSKITLELQSKELLIKTL